MKKHLFSEWKRFKDTKGNNHEQSVNQCSYGSTTAFCGSKEVFCLKFLSIDPSCHFPGLPTSFFPRDMPWGLEIRSFFEDTWRWHPKMGHWWPNGQVAEGSLWKGWVLDKTKVEDVSHIAPAGSVENPSICFQRKSPVVLILDTLQHEAIGERKDTLVGRDKRRMNFPSDDILVSTPSGPSVDGFEKRIWGKEATPSTRISRKHSQLKKKW